MLCAPSGAACRASISFSSISHCCPSLNRNARRRNRNVQAGVGGRDAARAGRAPKHAHRPRRPPDHGGRGGGGDHRAGCGPQVRLGGLLRCWKCLLSVNVMFVQHAVHGLRKLRPSALPACSSICFARLRRPHPRLALIDPPAGRRWSRPRPGRRVRRTSWNAREVRGPAPTARLTYRSSPSRRLPVAPPPHVYKFNAHPRPPSPCSRGRGRGAAALPGGGAPPGARGLRHGCACCAALRCCCVRGAPRASPAFDAPRGSGPSPRQRNPVPVPFLLPIHVDPPFPSSCQSNPCWSPPQASRWTGSRS